MKILIWDIETAPMVVTSWQLFKPFLSPDNILKESTILCAAWKWLGDKKVEAVAVDPAFPDADGVVVAKLHALLSAADVLVAHNGDKFDLRKFNARALFYGLPPLPPIQTVDTLKVARQYFALNSNKLSYLGQFLGLGKKLHTDYSLWLKVMNGDKEALAHMVKYNKQDVVLLEKVYLALRPYIRNHPNQNLYGPVECCPTCGSKEFVKRGFKHQRTTRRQQFQCSSCSSWFCGETIQLTGLR